MGSGQGEKRLYPLRTGIAWSVLSLTRCLCLVTRFGMISQRPAARSLICLAAFVCWALTVPAGAVEEIKVPFNFAWGEAAQRLEDSLKRVQAHVVDRKKVRNRQCLVVEGIRSGSCACLILFRQRCAQRDRTSLWRLRLGCRALRQLLRSDTPEH